MLPLLKFKLGKQVIMSLLMKFKAGSQRKLIKTIHLRMLLIKNQKIRKTIPTLMITEILLLIKIKVLIIIQISKTRQKIQIILMSKIIKLMTNESMIVTKPNSISVTLKFLHGMLIIKKLLTILTGPQHRLNNGLLLNVI